MCVKVVIFQDRWWRNYRSVIQPVLAASGQQSLVRLEIIRACLDSFCLSNLLGFLDNNDLDECECTGLYLLSVRHTTIASNFVFLKTSLYLISNKGLIACGVSSPGYYLLTVTINPGPGAPGSGFISSKESSGSISTISQERPPHSEQMLICVNFKQFKSIFWIYFHKSEQSV